MPHELRQALSLRIAERITSLMRQVETVALFAPQPDEPNLRLLERFRLWTSRTILFPKIDAANLAFAPAETWEELQPGAFGLLTPIRAASSSVPQLVLVPGLAFTRQGNRLGRGAGFYDRYLAGLGPATLTVGVAFHLQLLEELPREDHDFCVQAVVTEQETIHIR
jgi:5-formyltetrahydrofolate cyclo-ligase